MEHASLPTVLVPQEMYTTLRPFVAFPTITFRENGCSGVRLCNALQNDLQGLEDPNAKPTLTNTAQKIKLRINVRVSSMYNYKPACPH